MKIQLLLSLTSLLGYSYAQQENKKLSILDRQSLHEYSLAKCSDGSSAAYYIDKNTINSEKRVMIYFDNSVDSFQNPIQPCTSADECISICQDHPDACSAPEDATRLLQDGLWSRETQNNPFANYFKVYLPSCTLDDFSGARGPIRGSDGDRIWFHGRHIFSSLLRDLVANFGIDQAESIVLIGSGSGARGVGHSCDYLAEAIANVNDKAEIKCILDGPDLLPYWVHDSIAEERCENETMAEAFFETSTKELWGRTDDESCVRSLESKANETTLAETCGIFSRYWRHVKTPMFIISSKWNQRDFDRMTCNVSSDDPDFLAYRAAWKQGIMSLIEAISIEQPANGWFVPNCQDETLFFSAQAIEVRKDLTLPLFVSGEQLNLLQVLNNWLVKGIRDEDYQAVDLVGPVDPICSANHIQKSAPLRKETTLLEQRLVPLDPLDDVPKPKGFPDGPPPRPRDDIFGVDDLFSGDRFLRRDDLINLFNKQAPSDDMKDSMDNKPQRPKIDNLGGAPSGRLISDTDLLLGAELFREQLAAQAERQNERQRLRGDLFGGGFPDYNNLDTDILYRLNEQIFGQRSNGNGNSGNNIPNIPTTTASSTNSGTGVLPSLDGANIESPYQLSQDNLYAQLIQDNIYRSRFRLPYDLLYYRYNLYRQQSGGAKTGTDAIFDPIDPSTPDFFELYLNNNNNNNNGGNTGTTDANNFGSLDPSTPDFFDYDYDVNVNGNSNFGPGGSALPNGVLPEQAVALSNARSRKARLWRKVYYLQYLRELYRRTYADYYQDYYYGIDNTGKYGRLTRKDDEEEERRR